MRTLAQASARAPRQRLRPCRPHGSNREAELPGVRIIRKPPRHAIDKPASGSWARHFKPKHLKLAIMWAPPEGCRPRGVWVVAFFRPFGASSHFPLYGRGQPSPAPPAYLSNSKVPLSGDILTLPIPRVSAGRILSWRGERLAMERSWKRKCLRKSATSKS